MVAADIVTVHVMMSPDTEVPPPGYRMEYRPRKAPLYSEAYFALVFDGCMQFAAATLVMVAFATPRKWAVVSRRRH